jgi:hypothetical protein
VRGSEHIVYWEYYEVFFIAKDWRDGVTVIMGQPYWHPLVRGLLSQVEMVLSSCEMSSEDQMASEDVQTQVTVRTTDTGHTSFTSCP